MDGKPLSHVVSKASLGAGKVYFDNGADMMFVTDNPVGLTMEATAVDKGVVSSAAHVTIRGHR
jgi:hypothetical protein